MDVMTLEEMHRRQFVKQNIYNLIKKIMNNTEGHANSLVISTSEVRTLFANAMIAECASPLILVQDYQRLYSNCKKTLVLSYEEVDYPFVKLFKKIEKYQEIVVDSIQPTLVAMHILNALSLYPVGIVTIEVNSVQDAYKILYSAQKSIQKSNVGMNFIINNTFDYIFLLKGKLSKIEIFALKNFGSEKELSNWKEILIPI